MFEADDGARLIGNSHAFRITCQQVGDKPGHERQMPHDEDMLVPAVALPVEGRGIVIGIDQAAGLGFNARCDHLCKQFGYRYCNRLHIELFGNTPGT